MSAGLDRFRKAQDAEYAGLADALAELRSDCKHGHWIWYVFPQLSGLGRSRESQFYGIDGVEEAVAYLQHPLLRRRLADATLAVADRMRDGVGLRTLMSSHIDAQKVVSSLTLFRAVAESLAERGEGLPELRNFADAAGEVLSGAVAQGYPACDYTISVLRASMS